MIYEWEGYMRDGKTISYPGEMGSGMTLASVAMASVEVSRQRNRRVIVDFNPRKKYKHFDLKRFYEELEKREIDDNIV